MQLDLVTIQALAGIRLREHLSAEAGPTIVNRDGGTFGLPIRPSASSMLLSTTRKPSGIHYYAVAVGSLLRVLDVGCVRGPTARSVSLKHSNNGPWLASQENVAPLGSESGKSIESGESL